MNTVWIETNDRLPEPGQHVRWIASDGGEYRGRYIPTHTVGKWTIPFVYITDDDGETDAMQTAAVICWTVA